VGAISIKRRRLMLGLAVSAVYCLLGSDRSAGQTIPQVTPGRPMTAAGREPSIIESLKSDVKKGLDKITGAFAPKPLPKKEHSSISLKSTSKPKPETYVAVARYYEEADKLVEAEWQYRMALRADPTNLAALLGYARLSERRGRPGEATKYYQQAAKAHPSEAAVFNNLGLSCLRQKKFHEAAVAMSQAIRLDPKEPRYRNNIAHVLVELGKRREAFSHLRAVQSEAVAYYNLGYLLAKQGDSQAAAQHFAVALRFDPSLAAAERWLRRLRQSPGQPQTPVVRRKAPVRVGMRPTPPVQQAPPPSAAEPGHRGGTGGLSPAPASSGGPRREASGGGQLQPERGLTVPPEVLMGKRLPSTASRRETGPSPAPLPGPTYLRLPVPTAPPPPPSTPDRMSPPAVGINR